MTKIGVIGVPSSAGARQVGQERAPQLYRCAGFIERLRSMGMQVVDFGDLPQVLYHPDTRNKKQQVPHDYGLSFGEATVILKVFVSNPRFVGLVITEFNAYRNADGKLAQRLVDAVAKALEGGHRKWKNDDI